jgi:peptidoglycan/xylan/chitin deacetylase (PgdA/CDA1 family)
MRKDGSQSSNIKPQKNYFSSMYKKKVLLLIFTSLTGLITNAQPKIILKLDDLGIKKGFCESAPTLDYLVKKQIKAGLGVIADRLDSTARTVLTPYLNATNSKGEKLFEFWNHGLDHVRPEFLGTPYDYQKVHFDQATKLIQHQLGVTLHSFGTPFNGSDSTTNKVFSEDSNYKVFIFSSLALGASSDIFNLKNRVNMENGTGNPEFDYFIANYNKYKDKYTDYMVLQGHPNKWKEKEMEQFKLIIDFLIAQGFEFVTPYEYYLKIKSRP